MDRDKHGDVNGSEVTLNKRMSDTHCVHVLVQDKCETRVQDILNVPYTIHQLSRGNLTENNSSGNNDDRNTDGGNNLFFTPCTDLGSGYTA